MVHIYYPISALVNLIASLILGITVLIKRPHDPLARSISYMGFAAVVWALPYFFWLVSDTAETALLFSRLLMVGALCGPPIFVKIVLLFLGEYKQKKRIVHVGIFLSVFFAILLVYPVMVSHVEPVEGFPFWPKPGLAFGPFLVYFFGYYLYALYLVIRSYRKATGIKSMQMKIILAGLAIGYTASATNFFLWYDIPIKPYGNILFSVYVYATAYAILRHQFLDIKVVLSKTAVYFFALATVSVPSMALLYYSGQITSTYAAVLNLITLAAAVVGFPVVRNFFGKIAYKYFLSTLYSQKELIATLNEQLRSSLYISQIYKNIIKSLSGAFYPTNIEIFSYDQLAKKFYLVESEKKTNYKKDLVLDDHLVNNYIRENKLIVYDELLSTRRHKTDKKERLYLPPRDISVIVPLTVKKDIIGFIALGQKVNNEIYYKEDLETLEVIAAPAAIAINNALLFKETKEINIKLEEEQEKTLAIIDNLIDPVLVLDPLDRLSSFNEAATQILGIKGESIGEKIETSNNYSLNNFLYLFNTKNQIEIIENKDDRDKNEEEVYIKSKDNEYIYKVITTKVVNKKHETMGTMKIFYNLTREKQIDKIKSDFITIAAHQLRTPITAIKWSFGLLIDDHAQDKLSKEQTQIVMNGIISTERTINLINELLVAARVEEGKFGYAFKEQDFKDLLVTTLRNFKDKIKARKLSVNLDIEKPLPKIFMDTEKLGIAIQHIIENAIEYTGEYGTIQIKVFTEIENLVLKVKDNGIGIPKKDKTKLFSKFFRAANVLRVQTEGSGLGLYVTKNIIQSHQGKINIKSEEGMGTEVTVVIPINKNN